MSTILLNDTAIDASAAPAHQSLLDFVRSTARLTGTKEGCASGDCGACTLILRNPDGTQPINVNSCITPVGAALGKQVITVEGVGTPGQMHPVQQALVDHHGSQCGFCTPGFVMSLVAAQLQSLKSEGGSTTTDREAAITSVSGNLCRCTGYRPIIDAALSLEALSLEQRTATLAKPDASAIPEPVATANASYTRPNTLKEALKQIASHDAQRTLHAAQRPTNWLLAGATDAFLEVSQHYLNPHTIIDLSDIQELRGIDRAPDGSLTIGAATTHAETLSYFSQQTSACSAIVEILKRFGSPQIRNRGTVGGNIANASPIADWPPLLMALGASVTLVSANSEPRSVPIDAFYLGYKSTQLAPHELIKNVQVPAQAELSALRAHKISKRFEDDISSALGAFYVRLQDGVVSESRIAYGGVGPVPLRCENTENILLGQVLNEGLIEAAANEIVSDITPISDVRASENYRREVSKALLVEALVETLADARASNSADSS